MVHQSHHLLETTWGRGPRSRATASPAAELPFPERKQVGNSLHRACVGRIRSCHCYQASAAVPSTEFSASQHPRCYRAPKFSKRVPTWENPHQPGGLVRNASLGAPPTESETRGQAQDQCHGVTGLPASSRIADLPPLCRWAQKLCRLR